MEKIIKHKNLILSFLTIFSVLLFVGIRYDYLFELNDDVLINDILSGAYTGTPESMCIQLLWPLSAVFCALFKITNSVPWFGLFLCIAQYGCSLIILVFILNRIKKDCFKIPTCILFALSAITLFIKHYVFLHYTITAAFMGTTAAILIYSVPSNLPTKQFIKKSLFSIILIFLSYCLRPNMMLLLMPIVGITGFFKWSFEKTPLNKEYFVRYLSVFGMIVGVMSLAFFADKLAYSSSEWKEFETLFANRTELYDFQAIPAYDENQSFYTDLGLEKSEYKLIENYNYGLDDSITAETLGQIAAYSALITKRSFSERLKDCFWGYRYRLTDSSERPWNIVIPLLYISVFLVFLSNNQASVAANLWKAFWRLTLLFLCRSTLWLYILINGRCPERISHSLYLAEIGVLLALYFYAESDDFSIIRHFAISVIVITTTILSCGCIREVSNLDQKVTLQASVDKLGDSVNSYCLSHSNCYYYLDVYSTIIDGYSFSEKVFSRKISYKNYDLLGGWSCNSPLYRKKQDRLGMQNSFSDLTRNSSNQAFLIARSESDLSWILDYYSDKGKNIRYTETDSFADYYSVYKLEPTN